MWRTGWIVAIVVVALLVLTLATARRGDRTLYPPKAGDAQAVWLIDNSFHTDRALPRAAILANGGPLAMAAAQTSEDPWIMIGWGDEKFYTATSPVQGRLLDAARAALGGRPTAVHLQGVPQRPDLAFRGSVRRIMVSSAGLTALMARVDRSIALGSSGAPIALPAQRPPGEAFFASVEGFSLFHMCTHWTAGLLAAAGLPTTPVLDTLPAGLRLDLQLRGSL